MKKLLLIVCLLLCSCAQSIRSDKDIRFAVAVADTGVFGSEITYYSEDGQVLEKAELRGKFFPAGPGSVAARPVFRNGYAWLMPGRENPQRADDYGIVKLNLENGSLDVTPVEIFDYDTLYASDDSLVLIQHTKEFTYFRSVIPFNDSESRIEQLDDHVPGSYYRINDGWLHVSIIPDCRLIVMDENFTPLAEKVIADSAALDYRPVYTDSVLINNSLYTSSQKEVRVKKDGFENEPGQFAGYSFALMKTDPKTLEYEIFESEGREIIMLEQLNETELIMLCRKRSMRADVQGNTTYYSYSEEDSSLCVFDTETEEFRDIETNWKPAYMQMSERGLYVLDLENTVHLLDPETMEEIISFRHVPSEENALTAYLIPCDPLE